METFLTIISLINQLFPLVIDAVKTVEAAMPAQSTGATKLALVQTILETGYTAEQAGTVSFEKLWPTLENVVSLVVTEFNTLGIFTAPVVTPAPAVPAPAAILQTFATQKAGE